MSITYKRTSAGEFVAFGPVSEFPPMDDPQRPRANGPHITVTKRGGGEDARVVEKYGRPFLSGGTRHVYAYLAPRDAQRPVPAAWDNQAPRQQAAAPGVYRHDGALYVVREFTPQGERRTARYCRKLAELGAGQGDRMNGDGDAVRFEEVKANHMLGRLAAEELLYVDEVKALNLRTGKCIPCGTRLRVKASIEAGIGPVCAGRQRTRAEARSSGAASLDELVAWATGQG